MSIVPPTKITWVEANPNTLRLTGNYQRLASGTLPEQGTDNLVAIQDPAVALMLLNGTKHWNLFAKLGTRIAEVPEDLDLAFLSHISPKAWPEITTIDHKWTSVPWLPLDIPRIEPDDWDLFWKLWHEKNDDITRGKPKESQYWKGLCCWLNPAIDHTKFNYSNTVVDDWSMHFPKMFEQIRNCLPFYSIEKIVLWSNINEVNPHFDPDAVIYPFPDSLRIMLWDTNEEGTFYMNKWPERSEEFNPPPVTVRSGGTGYGIKSNRVPEEKRMYVNLPPDSNTFVFNNGAFLHGARLAKPKIIMAIKGRPDIYKWLKALESSYNKYKDYIPNVKD
jgi:hypothetical protein